MDLLMNGYADRIDTGNPFCQGIGFFLIGVPDGRLLIDHICKQLTALFSRNSFIDPDGIFFTCQCKNRHRNFIGSNRSKINISKRYHSFSIPCRCYTAFVSVADLSLIRSVQASRNQLIRIPVCLSHTLYRKFQLADHADSVCAAA